MASIKDVATNEDMVKIANAIRAVTRTTGKMTIPQMPERLWDISVIVTRDVVADFSEGTSLVLGTFDTTIKHLFIVSPTTSEDSVLLAKVKAELELAYDTDTGELVITYERPRDEASSVNLKVVDMLLPQQDVSAGFLVNQGTGGAGTLEEYDETSYYDVGDTFLYNNSFGVTLVAHDAEEFNPQHNSLIANQVWDEEDLQYTDLVNLLQIADTLQEQKFDKDNVKNEYSDKKGEVYSSDYSNKNFAPLSLVQPFYASRASSVLANLVKDAPQASPANILQATTTNVEYNWSVPDFRFRLTLQTGVTLAKSNSFRVSLPFMLDRDATVSFGAKIRVSQDGGQTWSYISSAQAYGAQSFIASAGNTFEFLATLDLLSEMKTYPAGTILELEVYKKQNTSVALTTTVYCGVEIDGVIINTTAQFVVANVNIDTEQLEDGSVTEAKLAKDAVTTEKIKDNQVTREKLSNELRAELDNFLQKPASATEDVITYVDAQGVQHWIALDTNTVEIVDGKLSSGIELEEV